MTIEPVKQVNNRGQWMAGYSGNPEGRPKNPQTLTNAVRKYLEGTHKKTKRSRKEVFIETVVNMALEGYFPAIRLIWSYADGLPIQRQEIVEAEETKEDKFMSHRPPEERRIYRAEMDKGLFAGFEKATKVIYGHKMTKEEFKEFVDINYPEKKY
jgi:hypothetical protein